MAELAINCTNTDLSAEALIRVMAVTSDGSPYFTCDNKDMSIDELLRLLVGLDANGDFALRIYST